MSETSREAADQAATQEQVLEDGAATSSLAVAASELQRWSLIASVWFGIAAALGLLLLVERDVSRAILFVTVGASAALLFQAARALADGTRESGGESLVGRAAYRKALGLYRRVLWAWIIGCGVFVVTFIFFTR